MPSITLIVSCIFLVYIAHSMYILSTLFLTLKCSDEPCFTSFLSAKPQLQLVLFTSTQSNPTKVEVTNIATISNFTYTEEIERLVKDLLLLSSFLISKSNFVETSKLLFHQRQEKMVHFSCMLFWLATMDHWNGTICSGMDLPLSKEFY